MDYPKGTLWQLQDAKNRFSEVVEQAHQIGPQVITRRGVKTAIVLSFEEWKSLAHPDRPLVEVLRRAPRIRGGVDVRRSTDTGRGVAL